MTTMHFPPLALAVLSGLLITPSAAQAQCRFPTETPGRAVTYRFQPEVTPDGLVLHITLEFEMGASETVELAVPAQWAGEALHAVTNLRTLSGGASLEEGPAADTKTLHAPAYQPVVIGYALKRDWTGPLVHPMQFHPVLLREYVEFTGSNALVRPKLDDGAEVTVNFDWQRLPASWALATSFGTATSADGRCQTYAGPPSDVDHGLYAAGDFRIHRFAIGQRPAVLAVRGTWTFTDDEAIRQIQRGVGIVRDFWHDDSFPYFLVTLTPFDRDRGSSDGSAFTNAFWMYMSRQDSIAALLPQLAHEAFHAWNTARMGALSGGADQETTWFKEGVTSYYGYLLVYHAGALPRAAYVDSLNQDLRKFPTSTDPYVRGRVIALWLDAAIRRESHGQYSLDDVMADMVRTSDQPVTLARIIDTAGRYLSADSRSTLEHAVVEPVNLPAPEEAPSVGACARPSLDDLPTFDLGLDLSASHTARAVVGVVPGSRAFIAGLRDGQALVGTSLTIGDPDRLATFIIHTNTGDRQITFYPRGKTIAAWQYHLDKRGPCGRVPPN
jgi:predicted metalloprotease with PDZ domain